MTDPYEAKYEEMQKYVPFIQRVIEKLKVNNDDQADNPRKAQLKKMEMLHDLLTNKQKKIKIETLMKCEGVLMKLQAKIEKNEDSILSDVKMKNQVPCKPTTCTSKDTKYQEDVSGPASPPPEIIPAGDINQPIVIPTERRCSPILDKPQQHKIETVDRTKLPHDSKSYHNKNARKNVYGVESKASSSKLPANKQTPSQDKIGSIHQNSSHSSFKDQCGKNSNVSKERNAEGNQSLASEQKLQTVKVVITEPLPDHFRQQHFPPSSKFLPRSSVCHNNLKTLLKNNPTKVDNKEAYSPSRDQFNESNSKLLSIKTPSTAPIFSRLGEKVPQEPQKSKTAGRYTPIPDVLKSPPLSVSDINNLLLESGSDKTLKDISEIGTRRPPKIEDTQKELDNNSFEFVRKKLAQTAKLSSPHRSISPIRNISPLPSERIALKYNPHPRQERLQSVSSTDSSECSVQSKNNNPRHQNPISISQRSPSHVAPINVNVLPAINLSDPRLKRQSTPLPTPPERKSLLPTPPVFTGLSNQTPIYCRRTDPRVSRISNNAASTSFPSAPFRRMSINQSQHISEQNWDSDEDENTVKSEKRYERSDNCERALCDDRNMGQTGRNSLNQSSIQKTGSENEPSTSKQFHQANANVKHIPPKEQHLCNKTNSKNKLIPATTYIVPNAPKSDTEEDWDLELEATNLKVKPLTTDVSQSPVNISSIKPVAPPYHSQISPKATVSSKPPPVHPAHAPHIPHIQPQYPKVGSNIHQPYRHQNPQPNNRFNCRLNDTSERAKYLEAKKQKSVEPQTYREFREAKEKALAQEAAMKSAAEEAEGKKRCKDLKEAHTGTAKMQNANEQKPKQNDVGKKVEDYKKEKKPPHKDGKKLLAGESTLDKMYRTQNFNTSFPKANTSFKIPKKKTEEKIKEDTIKSNESTTDQTKFVASEKLGEKIKSTQTVTTTGKTKSEEPDRKQESKKSNAIATKLSKNKNADTLKKREETPCENKSSEKDSSQKTVLQAQKSVTETTKEKSENEIKTDKMSIEIEKREEVQKELKESLQEHSLENDTTVESNQNNVRDPRCRPKTTPAPVASNEFNEPLNKTTKTLGDIIITSSENQVVLKPQHNLEKFNKLTQEVSSQPQRILRRRNTMVVFDSAPLVDKEKLRKANALLFEDVQAEEKRKLKQAEEDKLIARRNKNLEEMFRKTDDNCTVSTQNIITGKRRTRATINFNETVNAINVFKHLTIKDSTAGNVNSLAAKTVRSNFKIKIKNLAHINKPDDDDSDDDKPLDRIATKAAKESVKPSKLNDSKPKAIKSPQLDECKTDESEVETKTSTKPINKGTSSIGKKLSNCEESNEVKFSPIQNEEHQNCAVSSTSADNYNAEENTCSSTSTHKSYKREPDDNEPTSTANKSNNPTPTPEPSEPILREIVDQILKPDSNRQPILGILAQILSEEKLSLIKSLIESSTKQKANEETTKEVEDTDKQNLTNNTKKEHLGSEEEVQEDRKSIVSSGAGETKKNTIPKKKRNELDRLNEDIRDMFICNGVLTATGRRMCTIMGKDVASTSGKDSSKESTPIPISKQDNCSKKKSEILKPPITSRTLRRSTRSCRTTEDNEDNESILSRTTDDSTDDFNSTAESAGMDASMLRKMPVLKPYSPIKIPDVVSSKALKPKETGKKRKSDCKLDMKTKKIKTNKDESKYDSESDEKNSENELGKAAVEAMQNPAERSIIKNTNLHWHNQSKYTTWCMICEKRIPANSSSVHYKTHHRENYISRMAPVLLQQYKQEKLSKPLFGIKKAQKQPSWFSRCPFCLKYLNTPLPLWLEHFQNHTVEFRYECSKCFRSSNKKITIFRHTKSCTGATVLTSAVKLSVPSDINAHVCHLCNFIQLRRENLERHYIEQHELQEKTVDLLGYTIKLFDVENVECVSEEKAVQKEKEVWDSIAKNEQIIDIEDDDATAGEVRETCHADNQNETKSGMDESVSKSSTTRQDDKVLKLADGGCPPSDLAKNGEESHTKNLAQQSETTTIVLNKPETKSKSHKKKAKICQISHLIESPGNDFEVIDQEATVQDIQDELLALAAKAAEKEEDEENSIRSECTKTTQPSTSSDRENAIQSTIDKTLTNLDTSKKISINNPTSEPQTTMPAIISSSIDMIYSTDNSLSETVKISQQQAASNVFMPTRDEANCSPTIQILAQSIINIEEQENESVKEKPITMAERLSQRFKDLQSESPATGIINNSPKSASNENAFEKLIDDTLLELSKEKDSANKNSNNKSPAAASAPTEQLSENVFNKLFNETVLELENNDIEASDIQLLHEQDQETANVTNDLPQTESVTVISDDEDWEDIEITETAPTVSSSGPGNIQKTKSKGLFQKFGMFKGSNTKSKKHLSPMAFLPKKKAKEKSPSATGLSHLPITTVAAAAPAAKANEITTNTLLCNSSAANLGAKPVINIMDGLFPDSPCNDPIDLVPELAPLEPLQDLNDISSILDSNLSAVNINAADNHTSIEDALDFISEQQANDKQKLNPSTFSITPNPAKATINNITHVGFSVQNAAESSFKFYCLLQNCSFLYSSDSIGLEAHFMCEHSQIKWNGYCLMCQAQCFPAGTDTISEYPISKEIRHMMEKHAINSALDLNTDSTQNSNSSNHDAEGRPKIKLRRLTGDCLSRATPENVSPSNDLISTDLATNVSTPLTMLGALLVADPMPPTREMPPQPQMPLTEPLLLDKRADASSQLPFRNVNRDFLITSVTSADSMPNPTSIQISNVISLSNKPASAATASSEQQIQMPKISNVRTLAPKGGCLWNQFTGNEDLALTETAAAAAAADSLEVSCILQNAGNPSLNMQTARPENDSPVLIAETLPIAQSTTGDFVVTQTLSAQYDEFSSTALGFNISIAASTASDNTNSVSLPAGSSSATVASRQYKCMGSGCKFVSRVPVAMSDHLRFHERRNFSNKQDYLSCGFCFYCASDVDDYMKHANEFHIINKGINAANNATATNECDTATSLTKKIHNILNSKNGSSGGQTRYTSQNRQSGNQAKQVQDSQEVYLKKLKATIDEIVGPTGLADDKLHRCVVKNCQAHLTESTFLKHIIFHITSTGINPNNYVYKCPHCTAQYHRPAGIKAHIKNHARNRYFCYLCDETSTNPGQLLKHFSEKHWHTLNMYTKELLPSKPSSDGTDSVSDSNYYVAYTQDLSDEEVRKFGEKLILEWQRKKSGSKTHFKSSEIDLLPLSAIFQRQVNCGECEYKTKVRTNMFRHLTMHKQNPGLASKSGASSVVDPVNPVPCLNSNERFFDKMTNLASSSLIPSSSTTATTKSSFKLPQAYVEEGKRYVCGYDSCNYHTISDDLFRAHLSALHSSEMTYSCPFCKEDVCKRGISIDRIMNHTRFHSIIIYRCGECNYFHHLRYVVERHINEKHSTLKVNMITHVRSSEDCGEGTTTVTQFTGKKFHSVEGNLISQSSNPATRSTTNESSASKPAVTPIVNVKGKARWECDVCGHIACTVGQIQTHCQQQHSVKNQYKCAHCNFGSQQLSQILHHIDEKHSGKSREARTMYHKVFNSNEEVADTRPLWQRNDPTRVRHIRGILMEDEEESEEYRKKLALTEDVDDDSSEEQPANPEETDELKGGSYLLGYEFGCYHCSFKSQTFEELKDQHYARNHNCKLETARPFWYRLHRRLCCPECRSFLGNYNELQQHLQSKHKKRFYAADIKMAENDDTSQRILCGYCSFHCPNADQLYKHHLKAQHWPQDIRIDNDEQIMEIVALGKSEVSYQCTLCADIYSNQVAIVQHACNSHAGEETFSYRELKNSLIYRCNSCCFTSTVEIELLRHTIDHYSRFKVCSFCEEAQSSFNAYMQHCYAEHKNKIEKFRTIYPFTEIQKFLLQILVIFPSGLVLNKRNLLNTKYGKTYMIYEVYEEIYKISQQPPIPRLSIARLVARKSVEAQQKSVESSSASMTDDGLSTVPPRPKPISKRRCTVAFDLENDHSENNNSLLKPGTVIVEEKPRSATSKGRMSNDHDQQVQQLVKQEEFSVPLRANKISKRRRTVAVDRDTLFSSNLKSSSNTLLTELEGDRKKRKLSFTHKHTTSEQHTEEVYPLNLDMDPFSFYGKKPEILDLSKIYTRVVIGGVKTPLTIDKFKHLFNIDCQLKLTKCDEDNQLLAYSDYKHIKKACPASAKLRYD